MQPEVETAAEPSDARRALLKRHLRGGMARVGTKPASIPKRSESRPVPLSYGQQQIWLHSQMAGESLLYNEPVTIHLRGELDILALEHSFAEIVRRHEAWRTTFRWEGDQVVQIVHPAPARIEIPFIDLRAHPQPDREREAIRLATEDALQPFDLAQGPLYRPRLVRLGGAERRLFLTLHHIIFDGVSLYRVFLPELQALYEAFTNNESPVLSELPIQYPDYAVWQRDTIKQIPPEQLPYWKTVCDDLPTLDLETDRPRPASQTYAGAMETFQISPSTTAALRLMSQEQGATAFMTMVASFMALLHGYTGQEDIVIGTASDGRSHTETEDLLGLFLNTIVIRCAFSKELPFTELLKRVRSSTLGALSHDAVPFELLVQKFAGKRDPSRGPLVQVFISVEPPLTPLKDGWAFTQMDVEIGTAKFDLDLELDDRAEGLIGRFIYNTDLFDRETIKLMKSRWLRLLDRITAEPTQRVCELTAAVWCEAPSFSPNNAGEFPVSFAQERLWFLDQLEPGSPGYNMFQAFRLAGWLDVAALERSLGEIVARHGSLRTTFAVVDGRPVQCIAPVGSWSLPLEDLSGFSESERRVEVLRVAEEEVGHPFDLGHGPLFRVILLRLAPTEHVLLVTMHHIVSDRWSLGVFRRELRHLYAAHSAGRESPLGELPVQYGDFAIWQREWLSGEVLEEQLSYWRRRLTGAPSLLELPTDRPRPPVQSFRGASHSISFSKSLAERLRELAQREGATLYMTLLAAFQSLLVRDTGQEDIVVGSPIAGRTEVETEGSIGFFANTLVLRTDLSGNPTFRELLERVREVALGAYAHQDLPFEKVVEELKPERDLSQNPLFQVLFALENTPASSLELVGLEVIPLPIESQTTHFDLEVHVEEDPSGLTCTFVYNTDLFEAPTIERMSGHFQVLLEGIIADLDRRVWELPLLTQAERRQVVVEWNRTEREYPREKTVHGLFEEQVERTPEAEAVVIGQERLSYGQLNERANLLARYLSRRGVGPEVLVGLCVERSLELVVGLLGILKAGGAYVPLDPAYPTQRLAFMLEDTGAPVVLTQKSLSESLPEGQFERVRLDSDWPEIARESAENSPSRATADNLGYVIYTSGSTGTPKGVQVTHKAVVNLLISSARTIGFTAQDNLLAVTTLSFDIAGLELFMPLVSGGQVTIATREQASDGTQLASLLTSCRASVMQGTPATWRSLIEAGWQGEPQLKILGGGEALKRDLADELLKRGCGVWNFYGPTETTIWSTAWKVTPNNPISIGRPLANTQTYILDRDLQPIPIGGVGELHIGGDGLARGYLNRPQLTAEKFIFNPFATEPGGRMYRTGDRARFLPDGDIQFLGRLDQQVKIRGYRIELGEIEQALARHPEIQACIVAAREEPSGDKRLVGYAVPRNRSSPSVTQLRSFLKSTLPDYMVPSAFVFLEALPLTPNGKVDRRALPAPEDTRPELDDVFMPPRTPIEETVAGIWCQVLGLEKVGIHDNFFDLGGHSLLAVRLFSQIEKSFDRNLPLAAIFQSPTVGQLASLLQDEAWTPSSSSLVAIHAGGSRPPFYCVHAIGGNVLTYVDLSRHLGPDQPVYGLQAQGLGGKNSPYTRIEEMAAHYIKEIRELQPEGPYYMGGSSAGGMIAYEMAQQLVAAGQDVAVLALFDTWGPDYLSMIKDMSALRRRATRFFERVELHTGNLLAAEGLKGKLAYVATKSARARKRLAKAGIGYWKKLKELSREIVDPLPPTLRKVENTSRKAWNRYVPKPYPGRIALFRATKQPAGFNPDRELGWNRFAEGGVEVYDVPGHHGAIVHEPRIGILARQLAACLERARSARLRSLHGSALLLAGTSWVSAILQNI